MDMTNVPAATWSVEEVVPALPCCAIVLTE